MVGTADVIFSNNLFYQQIGAHPEWWRAKHGHELRKTLRCSEHFFCLGEVVSHARLTKHMFTRFECGDRHRRMHIRRRADPNNIEIRQCQELRPVSDGRGMRDIFAAKFLRAFVGRIRDGDNLDLRVPLEHRQMAGTNNIASSYHPDSQFVVILLRHASKGDYESCETGSLLRELNLTMPSSYTFNHESDTNEHE